MRGVAQVALSGNGNSVWIPLDTYQTPPAVTLAGFVSSGANLTWSVQYTCDDFGPGAPPRIVQISQTANTITVTDSGPLLKSSFGTADQTFGHGLSAGDWYRIVSSGLPNVDGEYAVVTVPSASSLTLTSPTSQSVIGVAYGIGARVFPHATLTSQTGRASGNFAFPVKAARLVVSAYVSGTAFLEILQGGNAS